MTIAVAGRNTGLISSASTSWSITLPSSANNGDLYLIFATPGSASTLSTTSTGWTQIGQWGASATPIAFFLGVAGVASSSLTVASSASVLGAYAGLRVTGWASTNVQVANANGSSTTPTPPALTPIQGATQYLCVVVQADDDGGNFYQPSSAPSGFSNFQSNATGTSGSTSDAAIATAEQITVAGSFTPGAFPATTFSTPWTTLTVAIPAAVGRMAQTSAAVNRAALF